MKSMKSMKKTKKMQKRMKGAALVVMGCLALGRLGADPAEGIGLTAGLEFSLGNLNPPGTYRFSDEEAGQGGITPFVEYNKKINEAVSVAGQARFPYNFVEEARFLFLKAQVTYSLKAGEQGTLDISPFAQFNIPVDSPVPDSKGRDPSWLSEFAPQVRYTRRLGFGSVYLNVPVVFSFSSDGYYNFGTYGKTDRWPGDGGGKDRLRLGLDTDLKIYAYSQFDVDFFTHLPCGTEASTGLTRLAFCVGYEALLSGNLDLYLWTGIPTYQDGFKTEGLSLEIGVTDKNIIVPGLEAYLIFDVYNLGSDEEFNAGEGKPGFAPTLGVSYSF